MPKYNKKVAEKDKRAAVFFVSFLRNTQASPRVIRKVAAPVPIK